MLILVVLLCAWQLELITQDAREKGTNEHGVTEWDARGCKFERDRGSVHVYLCVRDECPPPSPYLLPSARVTWN